MFNQRSSHSGDHSMNRRAFLTDFAGKAAACAAVMTSHASEVKGTTEALARDFASQISDLHASFSTRIQAFEAANDELKTLLQNATTEVLTSYGALKNRVDTLEVKNALMVAWLSILTILSGVDLITPFIDQLNLFA